MEELKQEYGNLNISLVRETQTTLTLGMWGREFKVLKTDIDAYVQREAERLALERKPNDCSVCSTSYREQLLDPLTPFPRDGFSLGDEQSSSIKVFVGECSELFLDVYHFDRRFWETAKLSFLSGPGRPVEHIRKVYKPLTIRIDGMNESSLKKAVTVSDEIIDSVLYSFAYLQGHVLSTLADWPGAKSNPRTFRARRITEDEITLSHTKRGQEAIRYYIQGTGTTDPVLSFLAFYQVLEFYFLLVSDKTLFEKLGDIIRKPGFRTTFQELEKIIEEVETHSRKRDSKTLLERVLEEYSDREQILKFIKDYEEFLWTLENPGQDPGDPPKRRKIFSKQRTVFGKSVQVTTDETHFWGPLATYIVTIRNALVHSTDRYERRTAERHRPFTETTQVVEYVVPLMRFLAEQVVNSTSAPSEW
jgi:hypothetical protein